MSKTSGPITKHVKRISVIECWYPSYEDECGLYIIVTLHFDPGNIYRVSCWGADDMGLEIQFNDMEQAYLIYNNIRDGITQSELKKQGFIIA